MSIISRRRRTLSIALLSALSASSALAADPPRVVSTVPANGAADVDPAATRQLIITFDQKMGPNYSVIGNPKMQPTYTGQPGWDESQTTFTVDFSLEPDRFYELQVNAPGAMGFRAAADDQPAVAYRFSFHTAPLPASDDENADPALRPVGREKNQAALDALRHALKTKYSHYDRLGIDWDQLVDRAASDLLDAPCAYTFAARLSHVLCVAQDPHMSVGADTHTFPTRIVMAPSNFNSRMLPKYVRDLHPISPALFAGHVSPKTAYIAIATWDASRQAQILPVLNEITAQAQAGVDTLIIDVRPNGGGDENLAKRIAARFITKPVVYAKHQWRDAQEPTGFGSVIERVLEPDKDAPTFTGKVYVLTGPLNMSSNEAFILMMKAAGATLAGDTTFGASGNPQPIDLGNGVTLFCPAWKALKPDGSPLEGVGITPDIVVKVENMITNPDDPVLKAVVEQADDPFQK